MNLEYRCYVVYGKRLDTLLRRSKRNTNFVPYFLRCNNITELYNFIEFTVSLRCSVTLYNYNNMPYNVENADFQFMENNMNRDYEISAYDSVKINEQHLKKHLKMVKYMYNY